MSGLLNTVEIGIRVRMARRSRGWSQSELGQALDPPRTHAAVSAIELGRTKFTTRLLNQLSQALLRPWPWFIGSDAVDGLSPIATPSLSSAMSSARTTAVNAATRLVLAPNGQMSAPTVQAMLDAALDIEMWILREEGA